MAHEGYHEPVEELTRATRDLHMALVSLQEELEAIDWYQQRIDAAGDPELAAILAHNRDEEKEHASMVLEWLRRHDAVLNQHLRTYLFAKGSIVRVEEEAEGERAGDTRPADGGSLQVGSLRGEGTL